MNITIELTENDLTDNDKLIIKDCLELKENEDFEMVLGKLSKTALMEYLKMITGNGLPTKAEEVKQERFLFLLEYYFQGKLPNENQLSSIFQITQSQSKTLLRNTKSRYRTKISNHIKKSLIETISSFCFNKDRERFEFVCCSPTIIEDLNLIISQRGAEHELVQKIKDSASKYYCIIDTYDFLKKHFNIK
jgi:hypothetical protein